MTDILITGDTWGDEIDGVRAFLEGEAGKTFADLRPAVQTAREQLLAQLDGVSEEQAAYRPPGGEGEEAWGIAEVLRHIISIEAIFAERIRQLGLGLELNLTQTYPGYMESIGRKPLPELVLALTASRLTMLAAVEEIEGSERLDTTDAHRRFGDLNCRGWFRMQGLHELDHARQIERMKAQPGFPGL